MLLEKPAGRMYVDARFYCFEDLVTPSLIETEEVRSMTGRGHDVLDFLQFKDFFQSCQGLGQRRSLK